MLTKKFIVQNLFAAIGDTFDNILNFDLPLGKNFLILIKKRKKNWNLPSKYQQSSQ
jgi:hypothetical protein